MLSGEEKQQEDGELISGLRRVQFHSSPEVVAQAPHPMMGQEITPPALSSQAQASKLPASTFTRPSAPAFTQPPQPSAYKLSMFNGARDPVVNLPDFSPPSQQRQQPERQKSPELNLNPIKQDRELEAMKTLDAWRQSNKNIRDQLRAVQKEFEMAAMNSPLTGLSAPLTPASPPPTMAVNTPAGEFKSFTSSLERLEKENHLLMKCIQDLQQDLQVAVNTATPSTPAF